MAYSLKSIYLSLLRSLNRFFSGVFFLAILCLLFLFGLQLKHLSGMDSLRPIVQLHRWGDPLLGLLAKRLGTAWPTVGSSYFPLGVGVGVWMWWVRPR